MKRAILSLLTTIIYFAASAREVYPLCDDWRFFFKSENSSDNARCVSLPHTWNTDAMAGSLNYLQTTANYSKNIFIPNEWQSKRLFLKFYGVRNVADVFVNGIHAGEHRGGTTAFTFEITDKIKFGGENLLLVVVDNAFHNDVLPTSTEQNIYGGIYRDVELIVTDRTAVSPLYFGSDGVIVHQRAISAETAEGTVDVYISGKQDALHHLTVTITDADGNRAVSKSQKIKIDNKRVSVPFEIPCPKLWSPDSPHMYTVDVTVDDANGSDRVSVRTGFRSIEVTPSGGLTVNGKRLDVQGVSVHYDRKDTGPLYAAADYDKDIDFITEMGANAVRSASGPHGGYLYDLCDKKGLLVWIDLPFTRAPYLSDIPYYATTRFHDNGKTQLREIIAQNCNHPSVMMWGLFSSLWQRGDDMKGYIDELNSIVKEMDPSRPTVACSDQNGSINFVTDLIVWQQRVGWDRGKPEDVKVWSNLLHRDWKQLRSGVCYGAPGMTELQPDDISRAARSGSAYPERRQTHFHEEYAKYLCRDSLFWGIWINNMFDYGSARNQYGINASGLVTYGHDRRKDAFYLYKALWNKTSPTLYITERRWKVRDGGSQVFKIYSSAEKPVLKINGDTVAVTEYAPCQYLSDTVTIVGRGVIEAGAGGLSDRIEIINHTALKPKRTGGLPKRVGLSPIS